MMIKFRARRWTSKVLAQRIADILVGREDAMKSDPDEINGIFWIEDSNKWQIGSGNNFWLHPEGPEKDEIWVLNGRYWTRARMNALATILEWLLGVELIEDD